MALTITTIRNSKVISVHGRMLAIDRNEVLVGPRALRLEIQDINTTVPTTLSLYGYARISGLTSTQGPVQNNLPVPVAGLEKCIFMNCTSTASIQFLSTPNGAAVYSSLGTTGNSVNFVGPGGYHVLVGISSTIWATRGHSVTTNTTST